MQMMTFILLHLFILFILAEEAVSKDGLFNAKQETFEEIQQGAEASGAPNR